MKQQSILSTIGTLALLLSPTSDRMVNEFHWDAGRNMPGAVAPATPGTSSAVLGTAPMSDELRENLRCKERLVAALSAVGKDIT